MNNMKFYISGKIGKEIPSPETLAKFKEAEDMLKAKGFDTFNPTTSGLGDLAELLTRFRLSLHQEITDEDIQKRRMRNWYECILALDIEELTFCDAIYMMSDYMESPDSRVELAFALATGKQIFFASREHAVLYLEDVWRAGNKVMKMRTPRYKYVDLNLQKTWIPISAIE